MGISIAANSPYWLSGKASEATITQSSAKTNVEAAPQEAAAASTKSAAGSSDTLPSTTAAATASTVTTTQEVASAKTWQERLEEIKAKWATPLTDEEKSALSEKNRTLNIESNLDIATPRPAFEVTYSDVNTSFYYFDGSSFMGGLMPGMGAKRAEMNALLMGSELDFAIQQAYEYAKLGAELNDPQIGASNAALFLSGSLTVEGATLEFADGGNAFQYAREAIFQRSSVELGNGIDIAQLLQGQGYVTAEEYAALPPLTLPAGSEKLATYTEKYTARIEGEKLAQAQAPKVDEFSPLAALKNLPSSLVIRNGDVPGLDLGENVLLISNTSSGEVALKDAAQSIRQNADGSYTSSDGYTVIALPAQWVDGFIAAFGVDGINPPPSEETQDASTDIYQRALQSYGLSQDNASLTYSSLLPSKVVAIEIRNPGADTEIHVGRLIEQMLESGQKSIVTDDYSISLLDITPEMRNYLGSIGISDQAPTSAQTVAASYEKQNADLLEAFRLAQNTASSNLASGGKNELIEELLA